MLLCGLYYTPALRRRLFEFAWLGGTLKLGRGCYEVGSGGIVPALGVKLVRGLFCYSFIYLT